MLQNRLIAKRIYFDYEKNSRGFPGYLNLRIQFILRTSVRSGTLPILPLTLRKDLRICVLNLVPLYSPSKKFLLTSLFQKICQTIIAKYSEKSTISDFFAAIKDSSPTSFILKLNTFESLSRKYFAFSLQSIFISD